MSSLNIQRKILNIISDLHGVDKKGFNSYQRYNYTRQEDVINSIRPLLIENKLLILSDLIEEETMVIEGSGILCKVTLEFNIIDIDTGDSIKVRTKGHGMDKGDKSIYKAITGAEKYFYMKNFLIGTPNDDAESDENLDKLLDETFNRRNQGNNPNYNKKVQSHNTYNPNNRGNTRGINQNNSQNNSQNNKVNPNNNNNLGRSPVVNNIVCNNPTNEKTIDKRLQDFLFVASRQNQDIVVKAINRFGYNSLENIKVSDYKKILELIKQNVGKLAGTI